ncbi:MAG: hypothetical protein DRI61_04315 [Chloroflexi bacterium]|nr:MAG: hypothetical protein DRI61_04315 [Chloroflexota bacterium]HDN79941.1 hypothetical protein [Chloroflexota bacterium]
MPWAKKRVIKASEINQYVFCPRAWWWREVEGFEPEDVERLAEGERFHQRYSGQVFLLEKLWVIAWVLLVVGVCLIVAGIVLF